MRVNMNEPSIYDDLSTDLGEKVLQLQQQNDNLHDHIEALEKDVHKLCKELIQMKKIEENLKRNISELYKTAKTEIARKDRMIAKLQTELDSLLFRRKNRYVNDTNGKVEVTFSSKFSNKRSSIDVHAEDESISSKRIKCKPINETSIKENDVLHAKSSDDNRDRISRSRSSSTYSHDHCESCAGSMERDHHQSLRNNNDKARYISKNHKNSSKERDRHCSSKQEHTQSRSRSKERDRFHSNKEKRRSRTRSRDRERRYSSNKESSRRQNKSSYKRGSDYYEKNPTRHIYKLHSRLKDENKIISETHEWDDKKVSESKDDKSCKNISSSSKSSTSFRKVEENVNNQKTVVKSKNLENVKTAIITDTHKVAPENQNEIDRGHIVKNGDVDHIPHLENTDDLNNKDILVKLSENDLCKNQDFIITDSAHVTKSISNIQLTNLDNTTVIPSNIKESVESGENQNGRITTNNIVDTLVTQCTKNESASLEASRNDTINNSGISTDVSPDTKGVNLGQNQSDKIKLNTRRRRRCVIKIIN